MSLHAVGGQDGGYTSFHLSLRSILDLAYGVYDQRIRVNFPSHWCLSHHLRLAERSELGERYAISFLTVHLPYSRCPYGMNVSE